jgi:hypothetical protein
MLVAVALTLAIGLFPVTATAHTGDRQIQATLVPGDAHVKGDHPNPEHLPSHCAPDICAPSFGITFQIFFLATGQSNHAYKLESSGDLARSFYLDFDPPVPRAGTRSH